MAHSLNERPYQEELDVLAEAYAAAADWETYLPEADELRSRLTSGHTAFVGAGGSLAVAQLGVQLHETVTGMPARALTPVEFLASCLHPDSVVVVSDSMSHPDVVAAVERASAARTAVLLTTRTSRELAWTPPPSSTMVTCPRPGRDGYVATCSVLALSLGLVGLYAPGEAPDAERWVRRWIRPEPPARRPHYLHHDEIVCACSPDLRNAALDLEIRLAESGLGLVQTIDLRGLGHGRHVGLIRRLERQGVVVMASRPWLELAKATIDLLPSRVECRLWLSEEAWPFSCLELLFASFGFLGYRAEQLGCDPANPDVQAFGEALFRLRLDGLIPGLGPQPMRG